MTRRDWIILAACLLAVFAVGLFGAQFTPGGWYDGLDKPAWTPPDAVFGPVWTILYVLIAIAGWRVFRRTGVSDLRVLWVVQLLLNALWSWLFFGMQQIGLALFDIVLLWLGLVGFVALSWRRAPVAGWLFVPYLLWVSYAAALNAAIWQANG